MDKETIQESIHTAFGNLPLPNPRTLLRRVDPRDRSSAEEFRRELAGKRWQSLDTSSLIEKWGWFSSLRPEAYRYYLPALLTAALQEFPNDNSRVHSVVYGLRPSFWSIYTHGEDLTMREQQAALTVAQYHAVCAFLDLVFEQLPSLSHLAAQALHWGWNQHPIPASEVVHTYYYELRHFSYPQPEKPEIAALCQEISAAFDATPYPGDDKLCAFQQWDEEPAEIAMELRGVKWQSAHPQLLAHCYSALSFLTDVGFRYFLPAFLLADLAGFELGYESNANPVFNLTYGLYDASQDQIDLDELSNFLDVTSYDADGNFSKQEVMEMMKQQQEQQKQFDWKNYSVRRFSLFNHVERVAIIHYLESQAQQDEYTAPKINEALERYWRP